MDETGLNLAMVRTYKRSLKGQRAVATQTLKRGDNLTLIVAVAKKAVLGTFTVNGGTTGKIFKVYFEQVLVPSLWPGAIVVMDNLAAHKVQGVEDMIKAASARVIYLSPYSPDFNP